MCVCTHFLMPEWTQQYTESFIQPDKLQKIVDSFMEGYDKRKEEVRGSCSSYSSITLPVYSPRDLNLFFFLFSPSQDAERQRKEAEQQQEDEEGWVKVTRGPKGAKARPHSESANKRTLQKEMRKKKRKELMNFYTWQHRNTQKERKLQVLVRSFLRLQAGICPYCKTLFLFFPQILLN